jgi:hypothetical protein
LECSVAKIKETCRFWSGGPFEDWKGDGRITLRRMLGKFVVRTEGEWS